MRETPPSVVGAETTRSGDVVGVAHRLAGLADRPDHAEGCDRALAALEATAGPEQAVLSRLTRTLGLSDFERDLLLLVGLPEEHEIFAEMARGLHPLGEPRLTCGGVARVLGLDAAGRAHLRRAVATGPLTRSGTVRAPGPLPWPERGLHLVDGLWDVLRGGDSWPGAARPLPDPPATTGTFPGARLATALEGGPRLVLVTADDEHATDALAAHAHAAVRAAGHAAVLLGADALEPVPVAELGPHLVARGAVPVLTCAGERAPLAEHPGPVVVCLAGSGAAGQITLDDRPVMELRCRARTLADEHVMWQCLLPELNGDSAHLAGLLRVDEVRATRAVSDARLAADTERRLLDTADVVQGARRRSDARLPASVRRSAPSTPRDRLVTTPDNAALLQSLLDRVRGQVRVLHEWGFADVGGTRGVRALFSGPPGTGKTLAAHVLASELGLDLLTVDLSSLVSKWLGETEKNIGAVFDAAERCQAVLFFDEADAIFGRRTEGSDAQGRWANLETAYLLGRMDEFRGLVVLASNLPGNLDDAFTRRLDVVVEFDEPDAEGRSRLWHRHLPPGAPLDADLDVRVLADLYEVTGGVIRNAALAAAYHAAEHGGPITQPLLIDAVRREYRKSGRSFPGAPRGTARTPRGA